MVFGSHAAVCSRCGTAFVESDCRTGVCFACKQKYDAASVDALPPYCTLTGADDSTDVDRLWEIAREFPFVEWGILFSHSLAGSARYPSMKWLESLYRRCRNGSPPNLALHVCGTQAISEFLSGEGKVFGYLWTIFRRLQINLVADKSDLSAVRSAIRRHDHQTVITQHNAANSGLWRSLSDLPNHAVLFDESGGRGAVRDNWPAPLSITKERLPFEAHDPDCGYAGGLGPGNLSAMLPCIHAAAAGKRYWVDMESSLRDSGGGFDLEKVVACLHVAKEFMDSVGLVSSLPQRPTFLSR